MSRIPLKTSPEEEALLPKIRTLIHIERGKAGMTQQDVADKIGMPITSYRHFEAGYTRIRLEHLYRIAEAIGVSITRLLPPMQTWSTKNETRSYVRVIGGAPYQGTFPLKRAKLSR